MDKNTLSEWGWIIVVIIIIAILLAFATPFGKFVVASIQNMTDDFTQMVGGTFSNSNKLSSPKNLMVTDEGENYILTYDPVTQADGYIVMINGEEKIGTTQTSVDISKALDGLTGAVSVEVVATDSTGNHGNSPKAKYIHKMPGLYKTGTYTLIKSWEALVNEGAINATDGVVTTSVDLYTGTNNSAEVLAGDLVIAPGVTEIGEYAFTACTNLTGVWMPNSVTTMGAAAFGLCERLNSISLSKHLTSIPEMAFMQATSLKSITIPDSVTEIGEAAFAYDTALESVYIGSNVSSIGGMILAGCGNLDTIFVSLDNPTYHSYEYGNCIIETATKTLLVGCKNTTIPSDGSVVIIGYQAFAGCNGLTQITIPDAVTDINDDAFYGCVNLKDVTMSKNIKNIGEYAFRYCEKIEQIDLPEGIESLGRFAFSYCTSLKNITIPSTLTEISPYAFQACQGLTEIVVPEGITSIGEYAYARCTGVKSIYISSTVSYIENDAFYANTSLETISVSKDNAVFHDQNQCLINTAKKSILFGCKNSVIPTDGSVTHIDNYAFQDCVGLIHMYIPKTISKIEVEAFLNCGYLETIVVEEGNPAYYSVDNCLIQKSGKKLRYACKNSIIPSDGSVLTIENQAFQGCVGLTHVYIPAAIQDVDTHSFFNCVNIETIEVEEGSAYYESKGNCLIEKATKELVLGCKNSVIPTDGSVTKIASIAFFDETPITSLSIPESVTVLGYNNFDGCMYLESIYLPATITELKTYSLVNCPNLTDIYYDGTIEQWRAVTKNMSWIESDKGCVIHCTNGDVTVTQ